MKKEETKELVESISDYKYTMTECAKSLEDYMQLVDDQAAEINELKLKIKKLEGDK